MPRTAEKLTQKKLNALQKQAAEDPKFSSYASDAGQPGLIVQARRGRVRFLFEYRPPSGGSRRRMQIDDYGAITLEQARAIAQERRGLVASGVDPQDIKEAEERAAVTVGQAVERYLEDLKERAETGARRGKRSGYVSARRRLERHVLPKAGEVRIRDVTAEQVRQIHREMKKTPVEANRTLTALSAVFGWADRAELVPPGTNPVRYVERYAEKGERRALTSEELAALGEALLEAEETGGVVLSEDGKDKRRKVPSVAVLAIRLMALTGFRRSELLGHMSKGRRGGNEGLRWKDVDLDRGLVTLEDTKTGKQTRVLGEAAVELLREARPEGASGSDCVCPGRVPGQPFIGIDRPRRKLWEAAELEGTDLHSLRHTYASIGAHLDSGRYAGHVGPLLGHGYQSRAITERYITSNPEALRPAADAIAGEVARILGLREPAEVLEFPGR